MLDLFTKDIFYVFKAQNQIQQNKKGDIIKDCCFPLHINVVTVTQIIPSTVGPSNRWGLILQLFSKVWAKHFAEDNM